MAYKNKKRLDDFFSSAKRAKTSSFTFLYLVGSDRAQVDPLKVYIIATKKAVDKKAVHRNLAKRRLRAALQEVIFSVQNLEITREITLVLLAKRKTCSVSWDHLVKEVRESWKSIYEQSKSVS